MSTVVDCKFQSIYYLIINTLITYFYFFKFQTSKHMFDPRPGRDPQPESESTVVNCKLQRIYYLINDNLLMYSYFSKLRTQKHMFRPQHRHDPQPKTLSRVVNCKLQSIYYPVISMLLFYCHFSNFNWFIFGPQARPDTLGFTVMNCKFQSICSVSYLGLTRSP